MKRKVVLWLCVAGAVLLLAAPLAQGSNPERTGGQEESSPIRVVSSNADGIVLDIVTPRPVVEEIGAGGEAAHRVRMTGFEIVPQPGAPELPSQGVMLGIPPGAEWTVELESTDRVLLEGPYRILPGASRDRAPAPWSSRPGETVVEVQAPDALLYSTAAFVPHEVVEVVDSGYLRDQRFLAVRVHPLRYNPVSGHLEWYKQIRVRIRLTGADLALASGGEQDGYFEPVLRATILNYEQAKAWRSREPGSSEMQAGPICGVGPQFKAVVNAEGMHQITHADLTAAGFPVASVDPMRLTMCYMGQEIAIRVVGEEDHVFNPADRILFYAVVPYSRYTSTSTYWLSFGASNGKRMGTKSGAPDPTTPYVPAHTLTVTAEESHRYDSLYPSPKGDHWFWDDLRWLDISPYTPRSYTIQLKEPPAGVANAVLRVGLQGYTANLHELNFSFNGLSLGTRMWAGQEYRTLSFLVPTPRLRAGSNTLVLSSKDKGAMEDGVWLDFFSVEYSGQNIAVDGKSLTFAGLAGSARYWITGFSDASAEVYDVTDVRNVVQITGIPAEPVRVARLPSIWKRGGTTVSGQAGQDAILPADVGQDAATSAAAGGYGVAFQGSEATPPTYWTGTTVALKRPAAIQADPITNWRSPTLGADYLVITDPSLITEANRLVAYQQDQGLQALVVYVQDIYDEFNHGHADPEAIRSFLRYAYDQWSLRPSYVVLLGDGSYDFLDYFGTGEKQVVPPMLGMVDRDMGETATDHRYVAVHGGDILPDMYIGRLPAANLTQAHTMVEKVLQYPATSATGGWDKRIVLVSDNYLDASGVPEEVNDFIASSEAVADFVESPYSATRIYYDPSPSGVGLPGRYSNSAAAKAAVLSNFNQGALLWNFMGHSSYEQWAVENLLHVLDVPGFVNGMRLPVLLEMTCFTGAFHQANGVSLDEELIRLSTGGTVASWSPTGLGLATGHDIMQHSFYETVFTDGMKQLGQAVAVGTIHAYNAGYQDLVDTFLLLGDPALFVR